MRHPPNPRVEQGQSLTSLGLVTGVAMRQWPWMSWRHCNHGAAYQSYARNESAGSHTCSHPSRLYAYRQFVVSNRLIHVFAPPPFGPVVKARPLALIVRMRSPILNGVDGSPLDDRHMSHGHGGGALHMPQF